MKTAILSASLLAVGVAGFYGFKVVTERREPSGGNPSADEIDPGPGSAPEHSGEDRFAGYRRVLASGRETIPWVATVEQYFPADSIDHFITHYGFDGEPKEWQTVVYFNGRYRMQIAQTVSIDYKRERISKVIGDLDFVINEVVHIAPNDLTASYGAQETGGPVEWRRFEDSKGNLSALPLKIKVDQPLERFPEYRRAWGKDIVR